MKYKSLIGLIVTASFAIAASSATAGFFSSDKKAAQSAPSATQGSMATYKVTFVPTFTPETHPHHYRIKGRDTRPSHFSPFIGATYKQGYQVFKLGIKPTPGLELLSETGKGSGLMKEMEMAKKNGKVYSIITSEGGNFGPVPKAVEMTFKASSNFPMASLVAMVASSPDWFVGVNNVALYKDGAWVPSVTLKAYTYDSGGDAGKDYTSPNQDENPKKNTKYATTQHFIHKGALNPVGTFVFTKIPATTPQ